MLGRGNVLLRARSPFYLCMFGTVHKSRVGPAIYACRLSLTLQMHFSPPRLLGLERVGWRKVLYFLSLGFLRARFFIFDVGSQIAWPH